MTQNSFDFAQCLARVRANDADAASELVGHLFPLVLRIVRSHLPVRTAEEDLAQEVFGRLFARLPHYQERPGIPFDHWVARLTIRTCLDALRAERRRPEARWADLPAEQAALLEFLTTDETPAPDASPQSARELVERLLSCLPPDDRLILSLLDLEQKSVREISALTGWGQSMVKVRAFRARRKLRRLAEALKFRSPDEEF